MKSIYDQHMVDVQKPDHRRVIGGQQLPQSGIDHYQGFVREAANEIDTVFPRLPNPTLVMYIFPHLSGSERTPVPGYVTTFPFYEKVEYALPTFMAARASMPMARPVARHNERLKAMPVVIGKAKLVVET